jgi:hypothetical protein
MGIYKQINFLTFIMYFLFGCIGPYLLYSLKILVYVENETLGT